MRSVLRRIVSAATVAAVMGFASHAYAEVNKVRIAKQYGLGYLQLMIMEDQKLIEKHAKAKGISNLKVDWATFTSSNVMNDALISGNLDFAAVGNPGLATIWSKTRGTLDVKGVAGLNTMPHYLVTRNPAIKTIKDFTEKDKIAVPAVKVSQQAIMLEMAAAQAFGPDHRTQLDARAVTMSHPDATAALLSGRSEIATHFSSPPFQEQELAQPGVRRILNDYDLVGGPMSFNLIVTTSRFYKDNPKVYAAFNEALDEATAIINRNKRAAAAFYVRFAKDKSTPEQIYKQMSDPEFEFTTTPKNVLKVTDFMYQAGLIKSRPASWKDLFFANVKQGS